MKRVCPHGWVAEAGVRLDAESGAHPVLRRARANAHETISAKGIRMKSLVCLQPAAGLA